MSEHRIRKVSIADVPPNRRRGGDLRTLLSPATVGSTSGFMGVVTLEPGEYVSEHYHPYSEEFIYVTAGPLLVRVDGEPVDLATGDGLLLPINTRHRLENPGDEPVSVVFHLGPLAPRPELGHVDTEEYPTAAGQPAAGQPAAGQPTGAR